MAPATEPVALPRPEFSTGFAPALPPGRLGRRTASMLRPTCDMGAGMARV